MKDKTKQVLKYAIPALVVLIALVVGIILWCGREQEQTPEASEPTSAPITEQADSPSSEPSQSLPVTDPTAPTLPNSDETQEPTAILPTVPDVPMDNSGSTVDTPQLYNPDGTPQLPTGSPDTTEFDIPGFTTLSGAPLGDMGDGLRLAAVGTYTGEFMEDGSNDPVENVLALVIENTGVDLIEYAELSTTFDNSNATFQFTAIPAGGYVLVLESNRQTATQDSSVQLPQVVRLAKVNDLILDYSNDFQLYTADGVINLVNTSGKDYDNDIFVYYKTYQYNVYMGGVTYRARFSGGLADGAIGQSTQNHFSQADSVVVYMAYDE